MKMKKPELKVIRFQASDVIATSGSPKALSATLYYTKDTEIAESNPHYKNGSGRGKSPAFPLGGRWPARAG